MSSGSSAQRILAAMPSPIPGTASSSSADAAATACTDPKRSSKPAALPGPTPGSP